MNRAERRRQKRQDKPAVYMYTQDQIDQMIREAVNKELEQIRQNAATKAFKMFMSIPVMVLHDKFGFGKVRLDRFMHYAMVWTDAMQEDDTILAEIMEVAENECGIKVTDY